MIDVSFGCCENAKEGNHFSASVYLEQINFEFNENSAKESEYFDLNLSSEWILE